MKEFNDPQNQDLGESKDQEKVLTSSDITKLAIYSSFLQAGFNYERMQASGFTMAQLPFLQKIYKDDKQALSEAMQDNMEFINTHPNFAGFLMGLLMSMEEKGMDRNVIKGLKVALFGPLAGIGDALFWFTILPIVAGISSSFAMEGSLLGPILFFVVYLGIWLFRIPLTHLGYNLGTRAIELIRTTAQTISRAATILGITVIGGLIAAYVHIQLTINIPINPSKTVSLQTDFFDKIFPNLLPLGYVLLMYYLLRKNVNPIVLILITLGLAIFLSFLGWL